MPVQPTYPGLYVEELPLSAHAISAAPTSIAAFVGYSHPYLTKKYLTEKDQFGDAVRVFSFADFEREFGGLFASGIVDTSLGHAVNQFFLNGGSDAYVVGLEPKFYGADGQPAGRFTGPNAIFYTAMIVTKDGTGILLIAKALGDIVPIQAVVTNVRASGLGVENSVFDLILTHGTKIETYRGLDLAGKESNAIDKVVNDRSSLVTLKATEAGFGAKLPPLPPTLTLTFKAKLPDKFASTFNGADFDAALQADSSLDKVEVFNLLILPGVTDNHVVSTALSFAERKRAFMIVDPPYGASAD